MRVQFTAFVVLVLGAWTLASTPAVGQTAGNKKAPAAAKSKPVPRLDGKPDMTGVWAGPGFKYTEGAKFPSTPYIGAGGFKDIAPFRPGGEAIYKLQSTGDAFHDDPQLLCYPHGMPRVMLSAHAQQFVSAPHYLTIGFEDDHIWRIIPTDGRPHSKNLDPNDTQGTYMGNSVGHWEGDTLVVDTIGLRPWSLDAQLHMHSDALHLIERFQMRDAATMDYQITIDDPKIFTRPWSQSWVYHIHPDWEVEEYICEDNNKDLGLIDYLNHKK